MEHPPPKRWQGYLGIATVAAAAWAAYAPMLGAYFRHDDFVLLRLAGEWEQRPGELAHGPPGVTPVFNLLFWAMYRLGGVESAGVYHGVQISLHALVSVLVLWLAWQLTRSFTAGWVAGLIFAVLFSHHEAVGWIASGHRMLVGVLLLLAINLWLVRGTGARWPLMLGPLAAMLAPLAKDEGILVCLLGPLIGYIAPTVRKRVPRWEALVWFGLPLLVYIAWRLAFPPSREAIGFGSPDYRFDALRMVGNLVYCVPQMLIPDLRYTNYRTMLERLLPAAAVEVAIWAATCLILAIFVGSVWLLVRGDRLSRLSVAWCYIAFLPFALFSYDYARAPRYLYLPSIGLALLIALATRALLQRITDGRWPRRAALLWATLVVVLLVNLLPLRVMAQSRLRDGEVRRHVIATVLRAVPSPEPDAQIVLDGLPQQFHDLEIAVPLWYKRPVRVVVGEPDPMPSSESYLFRFATDEPGRLVEMTHVEIPDRRPRR